MLQDITIIELNDLFPIDFFTNNGKIVHQIE